MTDMERLATLAAKEADEAEVYKTSFRSTLAKSTLDRINSTEEKHSAGYGLRVIKDGRVGFSFFTREEDFGKALSTALSTSRHSQKLDIHFSDTGRFPKVKGLFDKKVSEMEEGEMVDLVVSSIDMQKQPGIDLLENFLTRYVGETSIATSSGCFAEYSETLTQFQPIVKSGEEAIAQEEAQSHGMVDTRGLTARGIEAALRTRKSAKLEGEHAIYLHRYAIEELLGKLFAPLIDADDVARKQSAWHDKLGKAVASESLSVYDDPTIDDGISSMPFDAEATPARRRAVIEGGMLASFLSDLSSARLLGTKTSGNAFRPSFTTQPEVGYSNLVFDSEERERMSEASGVVIQLVMGAHTANRATGDFSVGIDQSWLVKNGEFQHAVRKCTLVGNFFEILKNLRLADDDTSDSPYMGPSWVFNGKLV